MRYLRTNTATRITVSPFLDKTDGITPEVALTVTNDKLTFMVDTAGVPTLILDAAPTASGGANDMVHVTDDDAGFYDLELAAANVNYLGRAMLALTDAANHCPVFHEFMILPAVVYDALVLGTDNLDVSVADLAANSITATAIAADAIDADALKADAITEIQSGLATSTNLATIDGIVDDILIDTGTTLPALINTRTTLGTGSIAWTYNLKDNLGANIPDATIWVTSDLLGTVILASGTTDAFGNITFNLDAGTVYVFGQKSGYNFTNPDTEVVS